MKTRMNQVSRKITAIVCALFASLSFLAAPGAFAQIAADTWVGNTSANLADANWTGTNNPPHIGDNWIFGPAGTAGAVLNNTFAGGITVSNIGFLTNASAFTFANSANPIILTGNITNSSTNLQIFNGPISNASVTTLTLTTNGGNIIFGGSVNSSSNFVLTGSGTLSFTNTNNFTGNITVGASDVLSVSGPLAALGTNTTAIITTYSTNTNTLVITTNTTTNTYYTTFTYPGFITNSGQLIFSNTFGLTNTGTILGAGAVIANGPGALTLNATNSWTGPFTINGGTVYDPIVEAAGSAPQSGLGNATTSGRLITVNGPGALVLNAPGGNEFGYGGVTPAITFIANTNGMISVTSGNAQMGALRLNGGAFVVAANVGQQYETCFSSITVGGGLPSVISNATGFSGPGSGINLTISGAANAQMPLNVSNTGTGGPDLLISLALVNANASQNATGFNLNGGGTVQLTATNIFTGPITISPSNTLILAGASLLGNGSYGGVIVNSNKFIYNSSASQVFSGAFYNYGSVVVSSAGNVYFAGILSGTGAVTNNGPGTSYFFSAAPALTIVNGGQVVFFSGAPGTAPVTVNDGGTLGVIATPGAATGFSPATLNVGSVSGANIAVTINNTAHTPLTAGTLNLVGAAAVTVNAGAALIVGQTYPILSYTNLTGTLAAANFALPSGVSGTYSSSTSSGVTTWSLHVTSVPSSTTVTWTGVQNSGGFGAWDVNTTANWLSGGVAADFQNGEAVLFDDTASFFTVGGAGTVSPANVTFNNSANNYYVSNVVIGGAGGITLNGSGIVTNATVDLYTGGTAINNGTLVAGTSSVGLGGPLGALYAPLTLGNSATAALNLRSNSVQVGSLSGGGALGGNISLNTGTLTVGADGTSQTYSGVISGPGNLAMIGAGSLTLTSACPISNNLTIGAGNTLVLSNNAGLGLNPSPGYYSFPGAIVDNGWIVYGTTNNQTNTAAITGLGGIILNGPGSLTVTANGSSFTNNVVINGGILNDNTGYTGNNSGLGAINVPGRAVIVNSGGILSLNNSGGNDFSGGTGNHQIILVVNSNGLVQNTSGNVWVTNVVLAGGTITANGNPNSTTWPTFDLGGLIIASNIPSTMTAVSVGTTGNGIGYSLGTGKSVGYQMPFIVNPTTAGSVAGNADLTVSASLYNTDSSPGNATGFILSGGGTMALTVANYFAGPITVSNATLNLGGAGQLGNTSGSGTYAGSIALTTTNSTFAFSSSVPQTLTGVISGAGSLLVNNPPGSGLTLSGANTYTGPTVLRAGTLFLSGTASIAASSNIVISNGAVLDVTQLTAGSTAGSSQTVMGFGNVNGNFTSTASSIIEGGLTNAFGTLTFNNNLTLGPASGFRFVLSSSATGQNSQVLVTGTLACVGAQMHIAAPSGQGLDSRNYTLVTAGSLAGATFSPAVAWDVAPTNQNHYYITNINNSVVLAYSAIPLPTPGGVTSPTFVLRNQTPLLVVTVVPGNGTVTNVSVNASLVGGPSNLPLAQNGVANQWTNSVSIAASLPAGSYLLPATAIDTIPVTGYGAVSLFVVTSTETWAGAGGNGNFGTTLNWAIESGQNAAYAPGYVGDSLVFAGTTGLSPIMDTNYTLNGLLFTNGAGSFNITAAGSNVLTLGSGGITNNSANLETLNVPVIAAPASVSAPLTLSSATAGGGLTIPQPITNLTSGLSLATAGAGTVTLSSNLAGFASYTAQGTGTATLNGVENWPGVTTVAGGTLNFGGTLGISNAPVPNTFFVGVSNGGPAVLKILPGAIINLSNTVANGQDFWVGAGTNYTSGQGYLYMSGGTVTTTGRLQIGAGGGIYTAGGGLAAYGYGNMSGGTWTGIEIDDGGYSAATNVGVFDMSGGTMNLTSYFILTDSTGAGGTGLLNMTGGTINFTGGTGNMGANWGGTSSGSGVYNIANASLLAPAANLNLMNSGGAAKLGEVNLLPGGLLQVNEITAGSATGTSYVNFNGGTYQANPSAASGQTLFNGNITGINIFGQGGFIDNNGVTVTIANVLQSAAGQGVTAIPVTAAGSGYLGAPSVVITGGGGLGASAYATIAGNGVGGGVTGIVITCPGTGYTSVPTVTLLGGGGSGATLGTVTIGNNASGNLAFQGTGTTAITGANTYTNGTVIKSGTLQLSGAGSINYSSVFWVSNGATFDVSQIGGLSLGSGQAIKGGGSVNGPVTATFGSQIYPGADPAVGTLTFNAGLSLTYGAIATFDLSTSGTGANDQVVINGNQSVLSFANNSIHIKASPSSSLDTTRPYALFQNNSATFLGGLPNPTPVFDVAPLNAGTGHWLIQPNGNGIVLKNSATAPPTGTGSITSGTTSGTNVVRNTTIAISATINPGANQIQSVTVDLSAYGGSAVNFTQGAGNTWTGTVLIAPGLPVGPYSITVLAYDGNLYGEVSLPVNVLATVDTWSGADYVSSVVTDDNGNWVGGVAPGYLGDSAIFAGTTGLAPVLDQNYSFNGIGFASNAGPFVLTTYNTVGVTGGITNNSTNTETVNFPINLLGTSTFFSSTAGNLLLNNTVSGTGQLNAAGTGSVTLGATASYLGNTFIGSGASLILSSNAQWQDALGNSSYAGTMTDNGNFVYNSPGTFTNAGIITGNGGMIINAGTFVARAADNFTNNLVINGALYSCLYEVGTTGSSGFGATAVDGRYVIINNGGVASLDGAGGNIFGGGTTTHHVVFVVNPGGILQVTSGNNVFTNIIINGGTVLAAPTSSILTSQWGNFDLASSIIVGGTNASTMAGSAPGTLAAAIGYCLGVNAAVNYQTPFIVSNTGAGGPDLIVSGSLFNTDNNTGNGTGIIKGGAGTMALTGTNFFAGPITVTNGTLMLSGGGQLNSYTAAGYAGNIAISNGATFAFENSLAQTYTGVISGAGTLLISNVSSPGMTLSTTNTLTGRVVITSGTLALATGASFNSSSGISISGGAIFDVSQLASPYAWPATGSVIASGTAANPATVNSGGTVSLSSSNAVVLTYDDTDAAPQPALNINGNLTLGGNAFTVNTADGQPLAKGTYVLIQASGTITSSGTYPAVTGTAIGLTTLGAITVNGSQVLLTVGSSINTTPPPIQFSRIGNVLTLSWPTNSGWTLESNSINVGVPADWFRIAGSSAVTNFPININAATTNVFYRLVYP